MGGVDASDEVLWRRVVNGDGDAFGVVFDRHHDRVLRHVLRLMGMHTVSEDVTAMVFYEAWRRRAYVRMVEESILPWLLVTANNLVRNQVRNERRYRRFLSQLPPPAPLGDVADQVSDDDERVGEFAALREAFARLRPLDRDVLTLCVVEGMALKDAALVLVVAEGTVKSRLSRAKKRLGSLYEEAATLSERRMDGVHDGR
ncbi:RNA polymerase sigma factor [Arthrobacter burdickii]|uniref:RNA polymerase sigma factor n=1 Tax=Arthrobacter burdickii TaxID=3035920 RepID=A0ABT8K1X3_9MICC|nr:RNA polymerase sigma factor [Arthrobacter burdickii]MDN4611077.1 RNA polymerase sigma factor [Arthrobacter burdickii]